MNHKGILGVLSVFSIINVATGDDIRGINIEFVTIGNAGNAGDVSAEANPYGCGAVDYEYRIGKYEVTNAQWNAFTSAAGAPTGNPISAYNVGAAWRGDQQPTNCVSWYEALQFCNYLTSGDKSKGAYQFSGNNTNPTSFVSVNRAAAQVVYGVVYVLPTESEWYKAAYFKPDGSGYSIYGNGTDTPPVAGVDTNCDRAVHHPWNVGTGTVEQNGTFDMMGNIQEITETLQQGSYPSVRGGPFDDSLFWIKSSIRNSYMKSSQGTDAGFRIASIPEPTTILLFSLSALFFNRNKK